MEASAYYREVGHRVRRKRQMLGVSQGVLAARVPMPQTQLSRIERGDFRHVDVWQWRQLCGALLTTPDFLLGFSDEPGEVPLLICTGARTAV